MYIIKEVGIRPSNDDVKQSMDLINLVAKEARRLCVNDMKRIDMYTRREKTVAGVVPTDIVIAYEVLRQALEMATYGIEVGVFCYLIYDRIKDKFRSKKAAVNSVHNGILSAIKKMTR